MSILDDWSGWRQTGRICAATYNAVLDVGAMAGWFHPKPEHYKQPGDFEPKWKWQKSEKRAPSEPAPLVQFQAFKSSLGL